MYPDHNRAAIPHEPTEHGRGPEVTASAQAAEQALRRLAHLTIDRPSMTPADVTVVLDRATDHYRLSMDGMTPITDPDVGIDTARLHLDAIREPAVALHRRLDAARNEIAHVGAAPHFDLRDETEVSVTGTHRRTESQQFPTSHDPSRRGPAR